MIRATVTLYSIYVKAAACLAFTEAYRLNTLAVPSHFPGYLNRFAVFCLDMWKSPNRKCNVTQETPSNYKKKI
jgi:hypothetical protein